MRTIFGKIIMSPKELNRYHEAAVKLGHGLKDKPVCTTSCRVAKCLKARP